MESAARQCFPATICMTPGTYSAQIPQRIVRYPASAKDRWESLRAAWNASGRKDWSAWAEFEPVASAPGFAFASWEGGYFAEALVAKELHDEGYTCWQANMCHLFLKNNRQGQSKEQTDIVERMLAAEGYPRLRDYKPRLGFKPRDLDLTAHHPRHGWRFCEVKWKSEGLRPGQLETLAFLHDLLEATVEVVRVVPEWHPAKSATQLDCTYTLTG